MFGITRVLGSSKRSTFSCIFPSTLVGMALVSKPVVAKFLPLTAFPFTSDSRVPKSFCHQLTFFPVGGVKGLAAKCSPPI